MFAAVAPGAKQNWGQPQPRLTWETELAPTLFSEAAVGASGARETKSSIVRMGSAS
jgi:hypothetical protein